MSATDFRYLTAVHMSQLLGCGHSPARSCAVSAKKRGFARRASKVAEWRGMFAVVHKAQRRISTKHTAMRLSRRDLEEQTALGRQWTRQMCARCLDRSGLSVDGSVRYRGKTALVIGAGPAGMVAARYLAREGFTVQVSEKRDDPKENPYPCTRSSLIGLKPDAADVMRDVGIELPEEGFRSGVHVLHGNASFGTEGVKAVSPNSPRGAYMGERQSIAELILTDTRDKFNEDQIAFHYNRKCKRIDFEAKTAVFEDAQGEDVAVGYDLLVGADGCNSVVRQEIEKIDDSMTRKLYRCKRGYKSIRNLPLLDRNAVSDSVEPGFILLGRLRGRSPVTAGMGGATVLVLYRSEETVMNGALLADLKVHKAIEGREHQWLRDVVPPYFPKEWITEIGDQLKTAPLARCPDIIVVSKMHGPSTVLLGDAAHTFGLSMGIGANAAIVDAKVLGDALKMAEGDVEAVGRAFHDQRYDEMHALQLAQLANAFDQFLYSAADFVDYFVGWVYRNVTMKLRQTFPKLVSKNVSFRYNAGEISATQALFILRRDACLFAMACVAVTLVVVNFVAIS